MNKIGLAFFIFQVTFALSDFSPYRGECSRFGNFDIHIQGKNLYLIFLFPKYTSLKENNFYREHTFYFLQGTFRQDKFHTIQTVLITTLFVSSTFYHILA